MNNGMICVSVCAATAEGMIARIQQADEVGDVIEIRFDCLGDDQLELLRTELSNLRSRTPLLATYRSKDQGGYSSAGLDERHEFWARLSDLFFARDLEEDLFPTCPFGGKTIVSFHDFSGVPNDEQAVFDRLLATDADILKVAFSSKDATDALQVWKLFESGKSARKEVIPIAMGEAGKWTRILGFAHGAFMAYASVEAGAETASGQISAGDLIDIYRVKELDRETKVFGVIGEPVSQSFSPYFQNPAFEATGVNAVFIPFLVTDLAEFIRRMVCPRSREVELNFAGFSVTMPHKQTIIDHLDEIDHTAEKIGAVNTVEIADGKLIGYNTDAHGFITPLTTRLGDLRNARVAIFGAGGAARACVHALKEVGADACVFVREPARAAAFADDLDVKIERLPTVNRLPLTDFDIVVNATPIGMKGNLEGNSLFTSEQLLGVRLVYDLVTKPTDTPLISAAKNAGIQTIGGAEMLLAQGAKQFEIWTGFEAPLELMRTCLLTRMKR